MPRDFRRERWLSEALKRHQQSRDAPAKKRSRLRTDVLSIHGLNVLNEWCQERAIELLFIREANGTWCHERRTVFVTNTASPEYQLIIALHECGHAVVETMESQEFIDRYGNGYLAAPEDDTPFAHRIECLSEEFEAWNRGWELAKELELFVDRTAFITCRNRCLKNYVRWTLRIGK